MNPLTTTNTKEAASPPAVEPPARSVHTAAAQARILELRAMREAIPEFKIPDTKAEARRIVANASVPPEFVELAATAVTLSPDLRRETSAPNRVRDRMDYADAYSPLADEFEASAKFLRHSIRVARGEAGSDALATYALAKHVSRRPEQGELKVHVRDMERALGVRARLARGRAARKKAAAKKDGQEPLASPLPEQQ